MELSIVTGESLNSVWQNDLTKISGTKLVVFGFNGLGLVSYKKELSGETEYFQDVAKLSRQLSSVIICGCDTDTYGVYRHSAVIAEKGKILGVSDSAHTIDESEFVSGGAYRVYETGAGKIGVLIADDLFFPESAKILSLCDADITVCIYKKIQTQMPMVMLRANAFSCGVPTVLCAENYYACADIKGNVLSAGNLDVAKINVNLEKDYHVITSKRRGLYKEN